LICSESNIFTYDANGNILADALGRTFVCDAWNRVTTGSDGTTGG